MSLLRIARTAGVCLLVSACGGVTKSPVPFETPSDHTLPPPDVSTDKGTPISVALSALDSQRADALSEMASESSAITAEQLRASRQRKHIESLGYDPSKAEGLPALQASMLALDDTEKSQLQARGFVVSARNSFSTMLDGYASIYVLDLPVYVSADSILDAVYRSYDAILREAEEGSLTPALGQLLNGMRSALAAQRVQSASAKDVDFYLAVAKGLLDGKSAAGVAGSNAGEINKFVASAMNATGHETRVIFGVERDIDFSQFQPRGHYVKSPELERYFRTMMWLGRIDLRLIETQDTGEQIFHRRAFEAVVLMRDLIAKNVASWTRIDATVEAFVGESDYLRVSEIDALLKDLGVPGKKLEAIGDQEIAHAIIENGYGAQQIASQLIINNTADGHTLPLDRSFALFGQRYTVDSHVFSNVVFDRVPGRLMPDPLDVAYAAFGNDAAASILPPDLDSYAGALESTRKLVDAHDASFWDKNLYNLWSKALRALSPTVNADELAKEGLPAATGTDAWDRRILNTQLASWAQLRHNTVLYAKQSYTSGLGCAYPDAYVEPYPEFFAALGAFAKHGNDLADVLSGGQSGESTTHIRAYFDNLGNAMKILGDMAISQRAGMPHTAEQLVFINQAVKHAGALFICAGPPTYDGWYAKLDYDSLPDGRVLSEVDPVIADVHTQPTDADGNDVGRILHVGTGLPRLMVVTVNTCQGVRAYAGLAASYYELITDNWKRLTDMEWSVRVQSMAGAKPTQVPWTRGFLGVSDAEP
jgi:hypothetical protein